MKREEKNNIFISLLKNKKAQLLQVILFIVVTLVLLSVLFLWVAKQGEGAIVLEQAYAKNIALLIDTAQPKMEMKLNMENAFNLAEKNKLPFTKTKFDQMVTIKDNYVTVKLSEAGGYSYSFFNDVNVVVYPIADSKEYLIRIEEYK
jgi:hypothetical protein